MKFIHTADLHLGMIPDKECPYSSERAKEISSSLTRIVNACREEQVDFLLIAGDLFHKAPLIRELKEVNSLFAAIPTTKVVIIAGNHDYISGSSAYNHFAWNPNVIFIDSEEPVEIHFPDLDTTVTGLSYHTRKINDNLLEEIHASSAGINILLAHGGAGQSLPFVIRELDKAGYDYVALGHIHIPNAFSETCRYSGSPEPLDRNELGPHGYILGEIQKGEAAKITFVPNSLRTYISAELAVDPLDTMQTLREKMSRYILATGSNNMYSFVLTGYRDPDIVFSYEDISDLGFIAALTDNSEPDYDFDKLMAENSNNIIGMYIKKIKSLGDSEREKKALYMGLSVLRTKYHPGS